MELEPVRSVELNLRHVVILLTIALLSLGLTTFVLADHTADSVVTLPVLITNDTGADVVHRQLPISVSSQGLINNFYMDADAFNTDVEQGVIHPAYMPGTGQVQMLACFNDSSVSETTECNNATTNDVTLPITGSGVAEFAFDNQAKHLWINLGTAAVADWVLEWQYWNGAAYVAFSNVDDDTASLTRTGSHRVSWDFPAATLWPESTLHSIAGYWVRVEATSAVTVTTPPTADQLWYETGRWWLVEPSLLDAEQKRYDVKLDTPALQTFHYYTPHLDGVSVPDSATVELSGSYSVALTGYFDVTAPLTGTEKKIIFKEDAFEVTVPSAGVIQAFSTGGFTDYATAVLADSPVGYWRLDESAGNALDSSVNSTLGVVNSATRPVAGLISGDANTAYEFDGVSGNVDMGSPSAVDDIFATGGTFEAWINPASSGGSNTGRIVSKGSSGWRFNVRESLGGELKLNFIHFFSTGFGQWRTTNRDITIGASNHIAVVYDNSSTANDPIFYVNGVSVAVTETTAPTGTAVSDAAFSFILSDSIFTETFDGVFDDVAIYTTALSAAQIGSHFSVILPTTLQATGVTSGLHTIVIDETSLTIDTVLQDSRTDALTVADNSNPWTLFSNNAMPAVEQATITVGGSLKLDYQLDDLPGFQLVDHSGTGNTITARYPDTIDSFATAVASAESGESGGVVEVAAPEILGDFPALDNFNDVPTAPGSGFFVLDVIDVFTGEQVPFEALTIIMSIMVVILAGVYSARLGLGHALMIAFVQIAVMAILWQMNVLPGMFVLLMFIPTLFFLQWKRFNP